MAQELFLWGREAWGVRRPVMTARRRTPGGSVWLTHGKKARLIGWANLSARERMGPDGQSQREREEWARDWVGAKRVVEAERRERSGHALGLRPRSGRLGNWATRGMEGVNLRKGWSGAGPARLRWLGHQAENRERERFFLFLFSFPNLFQILISKSISTNFEFLFEAKQLILINQMQ